MDIVVFALDRFVDKETDHESIEQPRNKHPSIRN